MTASSLACHGKTYGMDQPVSLQWNTVVSSYPTARTVSMLTPQYYLLCSTVILHGTAL